MKGAILQKGEVYYTNMRKIFDAIKNEQKNYNWLITDCVCYPQTKKYESMLSKEYCEITGEALTEMVQEEEFQWIWGVLSGFKKEIDIKDILEYRVPFADGYRGFWQREVSMQHPLADIEIVAWDSSRVLLISKEEHIVKNFRKAFPQSEDLKEFNSRR
jgi:hypothetical protein